MHRFLTQINIVLNLLFRKDIFLFLGSVKFSS
jgi:hypothetical protein